MGVPDDRDERDGDLLARAVEDRAALEQLYRRYVRRVTAFAARRCATPDDVADVVAEAFDKLLRSAHHYDPDRGPVAGFVLAVANSVVLDHHRRASRHQALVTRLSGRELLDEDDTSRLVAAMDAARSMTVLGKAIDELPETQSSILRLVAEGLTPTEAAEHLGITANAARVRLARARRHLRDRALSVEASDTDPEEVPS